MLDIETYVCFLSVFMQRRQAIAQAKEVENPNRSGSVRQKSKATLQKCPSTKISIILFIQIVIKLMSLHIKSPYHRL